MPSATTIQAAETAAEEARNYVANKVKPTDSAGVLGRLPDIKKPGLVGQSVVNGYLEGLFSCPQAV